MHRILNSFEKRAVISGLSKFNVVNLLLTIDQYDDVQYVIFYKYNEILFLLTVDFDNRDPNDPNIISNFLNDCEFKFEHAFEKSHLYFKYKAPLDSTEILLSSFTICRNLSFLIHQFRFFDFSLPDETISFSKVHDVFEKYLKNGFGVKDSFLNTYKDLDIDIERILENINAYKHPLEKQNG